MNDTQFRILIQMLEAIRLLLDGLPAASDCKARQAMNEAIKLEKRSSGMSVFQLGKDE